MPKQCPVSPSTPWWGYALVITLFAVFVAIYWGMIRAERRVFEDQVKLFSAHASCGPYNPMPK